MRTGGVAGTPASRVHSPAAGSRVNRGAKGAMAGILVPGPQTHVGVSLQGPVLMVLRGQKLNPALELRGGALESD